MAKEHVWYGIKQGDWMKAIKEHPDKKNDCYVVDLWRKKVTMKKIKNLKDNEELTPTKLYGYKVAIKKTRSFSNV